MLGAPTFTERQEWIWSADGASLLPLIAGVTQAVHQVLLPHFEGTMQEKYMSPEFNVKVNHKEFLIYTVTVLLPPIPHARAEKEFRKELQRLLGKHCAGFKI